jgi:hypothetical protein
LVSTPSHSTAAGGNVKGNGSLSRAKLPNVGRTTNHVPSGDPANRNISRFNDDFWPPRLPFLGS